MVAPRDSLPPDGDDDDHDSFGPPKASVEVYCLHCCCIYMSDEIRWVPDSNFIDGGKWVCPIEDCDGAGFCFDIFPTDPDVAKQFGVEYFDDPDDEEDEDDEFKFVDDLDLPDPPADLPPGTPRRPGIFDDDDLPF